MLKELSILSCLGLLVACATSTYPTNVPISQASSIFGAIGPLASAEGHRSNVNDGRLVILFDAQTEIHYISDPEFAQGGNITIGVMVDDKNLPPNEVDGRMSAASKKAYEWLEKARSSAVAPAPQPAPAATMNIDVTMKVDASVAAPAPAAAAVSGSCQKLLDCQAGLAAAFCQAGGAECQFKIEISGMDDAGCEAALPDLKMMVGPLKMTVPNFTMPLACQ
jgi:hypothetical protein